MPSKVADTLPAEAGAAAPKAQVKSGLEARVVTVGVARSRSTTSKRAHITPGEWRCVLRMKRYRQDKSAQEADTVDTVRSLYRQQLTKRSA